MIKKTILPWKDVPSKKDLYPYLLLVLHQLGGEARKRDVVARLIERLQLNKKQLEKKTEGGMLHFYFNISASRQDLRYARYLVSDSPYGTWELSRKGKKNIPSLIEWDTNKDKEWLATFREEVRVAVKQKGVIGELDEEETRIKKEPIPPWKDVPSKKDLYPYLLLVLHQLGGEARKRDAIAKLAERLQLSKELSEKKTEGGRFYFHINTAEARQDLNAAGYLVSGKSYGAWVLSREGRKKILELTEWSANHDRKLLDGFREEVRRAAAKKKKELKEQNKLLKNATSG